MKMNLRSQVLYFTVFFISFYLFTIIGTITHELGHIYVAHQLGFATELHYASMIWGGRDASNIEIFWIAFGGPLQSMITGSIGFWYCLGNKEIKKYGMKIRHWIGVFLGLFWLRPIFNLLQGFYLQLLGEHESYFAGDEARLSELLGWPKGTLPLFFAAIGMVVCAYLVFRIVPKRVQFSFICAGIIGGLTGFWSWMNWLGPIIFP